MRRRRGVPAVLALFVLAGAGGCASNGGAGESESELTGCYQFEWTAETRALGLPWGFELLPDTLTEWTNIPDGRVARTRVTESEVRDHPFAYWQTDADSIVVGHPGGGGLFLTLAPVDRDLEGSARAAGDVVRPGEAFGPREARPVVARRVVCPPA